jgi:hypothetical protein
VLPLTLDGQSGWTVNLATGDHGDFQRVVVCKGITQFQWPQKGQQRKGIVARFEITK